MYHYVYKLTHIETNEFYIGSRTSKNNPKLDKYLGSMKTWKPDKTKLVKEILKDDFLNREDANIYESKLIREMITYELNRNYSIPDKSFFIIGPEVFKNIKHQQGEKNTQFGTKWITNGTDSRKIKHDEELPNNWQFGRKFNVKCKKIKSGMGQKGQHNSQFGTKWINNGVESKKLRNNLDIPIGWKFGYLNSKLTSYKWITNGLQNKHIDKNEVIPEGWYNGYTRKIKIKII